MQMERRFNNCQLRDADSVSPAIMGRAASYGVASADLGGFVEVLKRGAFRRAVNSQQDCRCLVNHEPSQILGRVKNGTLKLRDGDEGLDFHCDLPNTALGRDIRTLVGLGTLDQCSFGFRIAGDGQTWHDSLRDASAAHGMPIVGNVARGVQVRVVTDIDELTDVSCVTYPAYSENDATSAYARCVEQFPDGQLESFPVEVRSRILRARSMAPSVEAIRARAVIVSCVMGAHNPDRAIDALVDRGVTAFAAEQVKRAKRSR
jgi:HK97 family phage prohead protease